jgi:hypothetical protein
MSVIGMLGQLSAGYRSVVPILARPPRRLRSFSGYVTNGPCSGANTALLLW